MLVHFFQVCHRGEASRTHMLKMMLRRMVDHVAALLRRRPDTAQRRLGDLFRSFVVLDEREKMRLLLLNPVLLSQRAWDEVGRRLDWSGEKEHETVRDARAFCAAVLQAVREDSARYPIGNGPIEQLFTRIQKGELSLAGAEREIRESGTAALLSPIYVARISWWAKDLADQGGWQQVQDWHKLTLAAVESLGPRDDEEAVEMRIHATLAWIDISTRAITDVPDGRLFRDALRRGRALQLEAELRGDRRLRSTVLRRLGVLHLDPYVTGRSSVHYDHQIQRWHMRLADQPDTGIGAEERHNLTVPEPISAFATAIDLLSEAAEDQTGVERAQTLKPLAEALFWHSCVGGALDRHRLRRIIEEAIGLLDPLRHQPLISALDELAGVAGLTEEGAPTAATGLPHSTGDVDRILALSVEEIARTQPDLVSLSNFLIAAADREAMHAPERALTIWSKCLEITQQMSGFDDFRWAVLNQGLSLFRKCRARDGVEASPDLDLAEVARRLEECSRLERWPEADYKDAVIALAISAITAEQEEVGLRIFATLQGKSLSTEHGRQAISALTALLLWRGAAVNAFKRGDFGEAAELYLRAIPPALELRLHDRALYELRLVQSLIPRTRPEDMIRVIAHLAQVALPAEHALGDPAVQVVQECCTDILSVIQGFRSANATEILFTREIARGQRFAAILRRGASYNWQADEEGRRILARIEEVAAGLTHDGEPLEVGLLENEILLSAYIASDDRVHGNKPREVLANLRRAYDGHVVRCLLAGSRPEVDVFQTPEDLQKQIGERTVLLAHMSGVAPGGGAILLTLVITREEISFFGSELSEKAQTFQVSRGQAEGRMNILGIQVAACRSAVQETPQAGRPVSANGEEILRSLSQLYLGPSLRRQLDVLHAQGKNHLCIAPEGALHYFPFILLNEGTAPLGSRWILSYLPNLMLLATTASPALAPADLALISTFGIAFDAPPDPQMGPLRGAVEEAQQIAALFGVAARVNRDVTRRALLDAFKTSRRVHIATHGRHLADAPLFQSLYLPEGAGYAPIHAYEFLGLDLRHVDLVTLSACETALGRFDLGDNLRGLPAVLFLCGVRTIVGTLWEVETNAAAAFFTAFYEELQAGSTKLDAFAEAQRRTRSRFPEYRDWGCFYLAGDVN
jgi:CHAT domain-containing protein